MLKTWCIAYVAVVLAACSTPPGGGHASGTAVMGAAAATFQDTVGPRGNGP